MNTGRFCQVLLSRTIAVSVVLAACQPPTLEPLAPAQTRATLTPTIDAGYPAPISPTDPPDYPTNAVTGEIADGRSDFATPLPDEGVVSTVTISESAKPIPRFEITSQIVPDTLNESSQLLVKVPGSDIPFRLGDDAGAALLGDVSEPYVSWYQACQPECKGVKQGLHVKSVPDGKDYFVGDGVGMGRSESEVGWPWIAYLEATADRRSSILHAYNLETGEARVVSKSVAIDTSGRRYFATNEGQVAWVEVALDVNPWALYVMDLGVGDAIKVSDNTAGLEGLSVSRPLVIWWSDHWRGYDREAGKSFTIPLLGTSSMTDFASIWVISPPTVRERTITWTLELNGRQMDFAAEVSSKRP